MHAMPCEKQEIELMVARVQPFLVPLPESRPLYVGIEGVSWQNVLCLVILRRFITGLPLVDRENDWLLLLTANQYSDGLLIVVITLSRSMCPCLRTTQSIR